MRAFPPNFHTTILNHFDNLNSTRYIVLCLHPHLPTGEPAGLTRPVALATQSGAACGLPANDATRTDVFAQMPVSPPETVLPEQMLPELLPYVDPEEPASGEPERNSVGKSRTTVDYAMVYDYLGTTRFSSVAVLCSKCVQQCKLYGWIELCFKLRDALVEETNNELASTSGVLIGFS